MKLRWTFPPDKVIRQAPDKRPATPWHAVSVVAKPHACDSAKALRARRFLSDHAPRLPLPGCTASDGCSCTYKHHADRRGTPRRNEDRISLRKPASPPVERRDNRGRRKTDF